MCTRCCPIAVISATLLFCSCATLPGADAGPWRPSRSDPQAARAANERGLQFVQQEQWEKAEEAFRDAIQHDSHFAPAHNNLGLVLLQTNRAHDAAMEFTLAGKLDPHASEPSSNLVILYKHLGWSREAKAKPDKNNHYRNLDDIASP